MYPLFLSDDY
jgi:hypothetical protein